MSRTRRRRTAARTPARALSIAVASAAAAVVSLLLPLSGGALPSAAPENTSRPTISGNAIRSQTLSSGTGSWTGTAPITFTFQWLRCDEDGADCDSISSATGETYVLQSADVGHRIRVRVTATNDDGSASALSDPTAEVTEGGPVNTVEPRITGTLREGQTLSASTGTWTGVQPITFTYRWVRCGASGGLPDGSNCTQLNATNATYVLVAADVGSRMRVRVTATNSAGSTTAASNATATVAAGRAPVSTQRPTVTATWVEGQLATVSPGTWTGATSFAYQWLRCNTAGGDCARIAGATGTQYRITAADVGRKLRVDVTARNAAGSTTVRSTESGVVAPAGPAGVMVLPSGERSIPVTSVPLTERLIVSQVRFVPDPVRSRTAPIVVQVRIRDTRGYVVRDALVFARSTPLVTRAVQPRRPTGVDGWVTFTMQPRFTFPRPRNGFNVQFFVKAFRPGDNPLGGIAGYRLVQVRLAR